MGCVRRQYCVLRQLILICGGCAWFTGVGLAAVEDSHFGTNSDGTILEFDLRAVSRREVLDRLFANRNIKLEWVNTALADELISGAYHGSLPQVARQLLTKLDFILVYDGASSDARLTRVVIFGRSSGQASPAIASLEAALLASEKPKDQSQTAPASADLARPGRAPSMFDARRNANAASSPSPVPVRQAGTPPVPVVRQAPGDLVPVPIMTGLPSVAPIAGAALPVLPLPVRSSDVRK